MRGKTYRGAWLLAAWLALAVGGARGQDGSSGDFSIGYAPADPQLPIPLGSTRPEDGGLFVTTEFMFFRWNNPLKQQVVAVRGFQTSDNSVNIPGTNSFYAPGTFVGSGAVALDVAQLTGADSYQPGFRISAGWHFGADGSSLSASYFFLHEASYRAAATLNPAGGNVGSSLENTFLFSPVYNFPPEYQGPDNKLTPAIQTVFNLPPVFFAVQPTPQNIQNVGLNQVFQNIGGNVAAGSQVPIPGVVQSPSQQAATGIWNGATIMTESYVMRFQEWEITYRQPICETEDSRLCGLVGPRYTWLWDHYRWTATSFGDNGAGTGGIQAGPQSTAIYDNVTSNPMWGVHAGCQYECYLGHGFAMMCEVQAALFMDFVREIATYQLEDAFQGLPESKRSKRIWNVVPEVQGSVGLMWYPYEFIQIQVGYQVMGFFNTISARRPIDFDYSNLNPHYSTTQRYFDGFKAGIAFTF